ncbi:hypothetical protein L2E82_03133 [Cichorium intybus]|uniref:Uncharacterized protein n=1 Tax=Cichorium intybus TaxID=13427 RepID=A0ACB9H309_CICIN|nr:hypothetical protein L2E82_03133 [Cichorium intybus]
MRKSDALFTLSQPPPRKHTSTRTLLTCLLNFSQICAPKYKGTPSARNSTLVLVDRPDPKQARSTSLAHKYALSNKSICGWRCRSHADGDIYDDGHVCEPATRIEADGDNDDGDYDYAPAA